MFFDDAENKVEKAIDRNQVERLPNVTLPDFGKLISDNCLVKHDKTPTQNGMVTVALKGHKR